MTKYVFLAFVSILSVRVSLSDLQAQNIVPQYYTIYGTVSDSASGSPLESALVFLLPDRTGINTSSTGSYAIPLKPGAYSLRFSRIGYKPQTLEIKLDQNRLLDIKLVEDQRFLQEVLITSTRPEDNIRSVEIGTSKLSINSISKMPAFLGEVDVMRSVQMLPGVTSVGEGSGGINVRGGATDQTLILMDDAPIFNSSHLFGFFSVFNPDAVRDVTLQRGGISAQYGGRTASVLDVKLKEPDLQKLHFQGGLGLVSSRLAAEIPIITGKLSVMGALRGSFNDFLFDLGPDRLSGTKANFFDWTGKVLWRPNANTRVTYTSYISFDEFQLPGDSLNTVDVNPSSTAYDYTTRNNTLRYNWLPNERWSYSVIAYQSAYESRISVADTAVAFKATSGLRQLGAKVKALYTHSNHTASIGAELNAYKVKPIQLDPGDLSNLKSIRLAKEYARELALYAEDEWKVNEKISLLGGLRLSLYQRIGPDTVDLYQEGTVRRQETILSQEIIADNKVSKTYSGIEPRLSIKWEIGKNSSIKAGYQRLRQYIQLISNTTSALPSDRWGTSDTYIKPQISDQISLGYFKNFDEDRWEVSTEMYVKRMENITDYKDLADLLFSPRLEQEIIQGKGRAYGIETLIRKNSGFWNGWLGYTYSRTQIYIDPSFSEVHNYTGNWYPANYDRPHVVSALLNYRPAINVTLSWNFTYSTGRPGTFPVGRYVIEGSNIPIYIDRNLDRIPDYHRLDVSLTVDENPRRPKKLTSSWVFSLYNVYGRKNAYSVFFDLRPTAFDNAYKLSIFAGVFPSMTVNFKFQ